MERCVDCKGTGIARFYYDPKDRKRIWVAARYEMLPSAEQQGLRFAAAVCDCPAGLERKERTIRVPCGPDKSVSQFLWPRMERIRDLDAECHEAEDTSFTPASYVDPSEPQQGSLTREEAEELYAGQIELEPEPEEE